MSRRVVKQFLGLVLLSLHLDNSDASISLSGTRIIFDGASNEASINVLNDDTDILIQSWLDPGAPQQTLPFTVYPPLVRLNANRRQELHIVYAGKGMPSDKESVFWLNVQEIPKKNSNKDAIQLAVRQRIKVFFRPAGLQGDADLAPAAITWLFEPAAQQLTASNPTVFHVSTAIIKVKQGGQTEEIDGPMIGPGETLILPLKKTHTTDPASITIRTINDYGGPNQWSADLKPGQAVTTTPSKNVDTD